MELTVVLTQHHASHYVFGRMWFDNGYEMLVEDLQVVVSAFVLA